MLSFLQDAADLVLGQDDSHHGQPAPKVGFDHGPNAGKPRPALMGCDFGWGYPGSRKQSGQILPITEHKWRTQRIGRSLTRGLL